MNNLQHQPLLKLTNLKLLFIDTEYYKKNYSIYSAKLATIQYAIIEFDDILKGSLPKLNILPIWEFSSYKALLREFYPIWQSMFLDLRAPGRTIPIGYCLVVDIELLKNGFKKIDLENRSFYSLWNQSRAIDLKTFAIAKTGLIDPRLGTFNSFLQSPYQNYDGNEVIEIVKSVLNPTTKIEFDYRKEQLLSYINTEFEELFFILTQIFDSNYSFKPESNEFRAINYQEQQFNEKIAHKN